MQNSHYLPVDDAGKSTWINNFSQKLGTYATVLGIPPATVTQTANDAKNFAAVLQYLNAIRTYSANLTAFKDMLRDGTSNNQALGVLATAPPPPAFTTPAGDIFSRVGKLVQGIKANAALTDAVAEDLGIVANNAAATTASLKEKPLLQVQVKGGHPFVTWKKGDASALKLMVDRGTGKYELAAINTHPSFLDTYALPAMGQTALWKYIGIYISHDQETGDWSDAVHVTVTGTP